MLKLITKHETTEQYNVVYDCGNNTFKVVRVGDSRISPSGEQMSQLEIQTHGLDFSIEALSFDSGKVYRYYTVILNDLLRLPLPSGEEQIKYLKRFGLEFNELFKYDAKLRIYLPTHFKDLKPYLLT